MTTESPSQRIMRRFDRLSPKQREFFRNSLFNWSVSKDQSQMTVKQLRARDEHLRHAR